MNVKRIARRASIFVFWIAAIVIGYWKFAVLAVGKAPDLTIKATPEMLNRGRYLTHHVTVCIDCHSDHDYNFYSGPVVPGTEGQGGFEMREPGAGVFYPPNITPAVLRDWSDGEIFRAITSGVDKDDEPLFPLMPYLIYNELAESDVRAIVVYLRTLKPIKNDVQDARIDFPLNLIMRTFPKPYNPKQLPAISDTLARGKYLSTVAGCHFCHTPVNDKKEPLPGMDFAGGMDFYLPNGRQVRTANITPHDPTGIGAWDQAYFVGRFKEYADSTSNRIEVGKDGDNTVMPWLHYAGMAVEDLSAIYRYLRMVPPLENTIEKYSR